LNFKNLIIGISLYVLGQTLIWFQTNGQFVWPWVKKNPLPVAFVGGTVISYILIKATQYTAEYYDGLLWPGRFLGFSIGVFIFGFMTWYYLGEGLTTKTLVSLFLAFILIGVQLFWK
jgi:hypothetical protein